MRKYYFLGIGGISMSALAIMLKKEGCLVSGSDEISSRATEMLKNEGIEVDFRINKTKIIEADVVVYSSAIRQDNEQFVFAKDNNKKIMTRGQLLGQIAKNYEKTIAVAGSHGKTTTTAMIYQILYCAGLDPTLHLGGFKIDDEKNYHSGGKEFLVTEACEYYDNFLNLYPYISVITNVEKEHMDYFKTFQNQLKSFERFKQQSRFVIENNKEYSAKNLRHDKYGNLSFSLYKNNEKIMRLRLKVCEDVNALNCIFAYQVAKKLDIPDHIIKLGLESFQGVSTRFEKVNCPYFDCVVCDYAHHPTEIEKAIKSAKKIYKNRKIITIFQPHTFSRTKTLLPQFVKVFKKVEMPLFFKTYSAREKESEGISAEQLTEIIKQQNDNAKYFENFENLKEYLLTLDKNNCTLLFIGAGDLPTILNKNKFIS